MGFSTPPAILQKMLAFKAFKHENGKLFLWGIPGFLTATYVTVYQMKLFEKEIGQKKLESLIYALGKFQGKEGFKIMTEKFGYAQTFQDKKKLLEFQTGQTEIVGVGSFSWAMMDFENEIFIIKGKSTLAEEYKRIFGMNKFPIDYLLRGAFAAFIEELLKKKVFCIETKCIVEGKDECEFVIKPLEKWDKKEIEKQWFDEIDEIKVNLR